MSREGEVVFKYLIAYEPNATIHLHKLCKGARMVLDVILTFEETFVVTDKYSYNTINYYCKLIYKKKFSDNTLRNYISELYRNSILIKTKIGIYKVNNTLFPRVSSPYFELRTSQI